MVDIKERPTNRISLGRKGEKYAAKHLKEKGYHVVEQNYRCRMGEVDIIAKDGDVWVFVEVKTRRNNRYGTPGESITNEKKEHFVNTVAHYAMVKGIYDKEMRIDVIEVFVDGIRIEINHIPDAF